MLQPHRLLAVAVTTVVTAFVDPSSNAQNAPLPNGPIKLIVPFAPGGGVDTTARLLAKHLQEKHKVTFVVENRAGASGTIGGVAVKVAPPDGHTLLFSASTHVLAKQVLATAPYDPVADFTPIARVAEAPLLMVIAPTQSPKSLRDVIDAAKSQPDRWTAALPALGAASHIGTLLLANQANLTLSTVPYKGTAPALTDVAGGHTQILIDSIIALLPMAKDGKVKPIAVTSAHRASIAPEIPTAVESGYPKLVYASWYGVWAPKALPEPTAKALNEAINAAISELARSGALAKLGIEPVTETMDQFKKFIDSDVQRSAELLRLAGFKAE